MLSLSVSHPILMLQILDIFPVELQTCLQQIQPEEKTGVAFAAFPSPTEAGHGPPGPPQPAGDKLLGAQALPVRTWSELCPSVFSLCTLPMNPVQRECYKPCWSSIKQRCDTVNAKSVASFQRYICKQIRLNLLSYFSTPTRVVEETHSLLVLSVKLRNICAVKIMLL